MSKVSLRLRLRRPTWTSASKLAFVHSGTFRVASVDSVQVVGSRGLSLQRIGRRCSGHRRHTYRRTHHSTSVRPAAGDTVFLARRAVRPFHTRPAEAAATLLTRLAARRHTPSGSRGNTPLPRTCPRTRRSTLAPLLRRHGIGSGCSDSRRLPRTFRRSLRSIPDWPRRTRGTSARSMDSTRRLHRHRHSHRNTRRPPLHSPSGIALPRKRPLHRRLHRNMARRRCRKRCRSLRPSRQSTRRTRHPTPPQHG